MIEPTIFAPPRLRRVFISPPCARGAIADRAPIDRDRQLRNHEDMNNGDMTTEAGKVELSAQDLRGSSPLCRPVRWRGPVDRSEEHTSELQSLRHLVCR